MPRSVGPSRPSATGSLPPSGFRVGAGGLFSFCAKFWLSAERTSGLSLATLGQIMNSTLVEGFRLQVPGEEIALRLENGIKVLRDKAEELRIKEAKLAKANETAAEVGGHAHGPRGYGMLVGEERSISKELVERVEDIEWMLKFIDRDATYLLDSFQCAEISMLVSPDVLSPLFGAIVGLRRR